MRLVETTKAALPTLADFFDNFTGTKKNDINVLKGTVDWAIKAALDFVFIIAVIMFLYGSFLYITSFGDDTKAETAKKTITWSIVGLVIISLVYVIKNLITNEITS